MRDIVEVMLAVNAQAYSFEAGNVRHEHEWTVWEGVKLPDYLSFASFDDLELGHLLEPAITTVTRPTVAQGALVRPVVSRP